jgi:hypothetical protein
MPGNQIAKPHIKTQGTAFQSDTGFRNWILTCKKAVIEIQIWPFLLGLVMIIFRETNNK